MEPAFKKSHKERKKGEMEGYWWISGDLSAFEISVWIPSVHY